MKTWHKGFVALAVLAAVAVVGTIVAGNTWAGRGGECGKRCDCSGGDCGWMERGTQGHRMAKALGLSGEQKDRIEAIFRKHRDENATLREEMGAQRRELRKRIQSDKPDEGAIREQVKRMAGTGADLAVRWSKLAQEVRSVLTPEQILKFHALQEKRDRRIDGRKDKWGKGHSKGE
jgi:Spy/CpxP family protein refolding chaperone